MSYLIKVEYGDGLPDKLCVQCVLQINEAYNFRLICQRSDANLRQVYLDTVLNNCMSTIFDSAQDSIDTNNYQNSEDDQTMENHQSALQYFKDNKEAELHIVNIPKNKDKPTAVKKPYQCFICKNQYDFMKELRPHMKTHNIAKVRKKDYSIVVPGKL